MKAIYTARTALSGGVDILVERDGGQHFIGNISRMDEATSIITACTAYPHILEQNAQLRDDLASARSGWENATEALRQADAAMEQVDAVQAQLVAELEGIRDYIVRDQGVSVATIDAALAAAAALK